MRFVDEYREPGGIAKLGTEIERLAQGRRVKLMEVCGGHTHAIYKHGIQDLLPEYVELVHGPGCPVCVIPMGRIDDAMAIARTPGVIFATYVIPQTILFVPLFQVVNALGLGIYSAAVRAPLWTSKPCV